MGAPKPRASSPYGRLGLGLWFLGLGVCLWAWFAFERTPLGFEGLGPARADEAAPGLEREAPLLGSVGSELRVDGDARTNLDESVPEQAAPIDWGGLEPATWLGQVLSSRGGGPIAGALLEAHCEWGVVRAESEANGNFGLALPKGVPCTLRVSHPDFSARVKPNLLSGERILFVLVPASKIVGEYLGNPKGLHAELLGPGLDAELERLQKADLDSEGRFQFADLEPGSYSVVVGPEVYAIAKDVAVVAGETTRIQVQPMGGTRSLAGLVVYEDNGAGVPEVLVEATYHALGMPLALEAQRMSSTVTDAQGRFEIPIATGIRTALHLFPNQGTPVSTGALDVVDWSEKEPWIWKLPRAASLAGVLQDFAGLPVAGGRLSLTVRSPGEAGSARRNASIPKTASREVWTDAQGRFDFGPVPAKAELIVQALVEVAGDPQAEILTSVSEVSCRLKSGERKTDLLVTTGWVGEVRGDVVDSRKQPWSGLLVSVLSAEGVPLAQGFTASDGTFRLGPMPADPRARTRLRFEADGETLAERMLRFPPSPSAGGTSAGTLVVERHFEFARLREVRGWVVDPDGYAVSGVNLHLRSAEEGSNFSVSDRSDELGAFVLRGAWPDSGKVRIRLSRPGWKLSGDRNFVLPLPLADPLVLQIETDFRGAPAGVQGEVLLGDSADPLPRLRFEGLQGGVLSTEGTRFRIEGMRPGRFRPRLRTPGFEFVDLPPVDLAPGAKLDLGLVRVWPGSQLTVELKGLRQGELPKGSNLRIEFLSSNADRPDLQGRRIDLKGGPRGGSPVAVGEGLPRGKWRLLVAVPGYEILRRDIVLNQPKETVRVALREQ